MSTEEITEIPTEEYKYLLTLKERFFKSSVGVTAVEESMKKHMKEGDWFSIRELEHLHLSEVTICDGVYVLLTPCEDPTHYSGVDNNQGMECIAMVCSREPNGYSLPTGYQPTVTYKKAKYIVF